MKLVKSLSCGLFLLLFPVLSFAHDTDLYMASGAGVEPNILIMFDNSISMNETVQAYFYSTATTYDALVVPVSQRDAVWYQNSSGGWTFFANSIADVACTSAQTALTNSGHYEGYTNSTCHRTTGDRNSKTLRTGNYRNYLQSIGGSEYLPKLTIAKTVIKDFLDTVNGVRVGVMVFNKGVGGSTNSEGGHIKSSMASLTDAGRTQLKTDIDAIVGETYTPLAETLYEAGLYYKGGASYFNSGTTHISPIQYHCQRNYVVIITDGNSTMDRNPILASAVGDVDHDGREPGGAHEVDYDSNGSDYLDDVAKYLYDNDIRTDMEGQQNVITYTIGFTISSDLLQRTATHGHGRYFYSMSAQDLADAFQNIIDDILKTSTSFVAPIVPVSKMERTTAGDKIYLALFQPASNGMWSGNIKKYGVAQSESSGIHTGDIIDVNGDLALDSTGKFFKTSRSYWTAVSMDGGEVEKGGVGEALLSRSTARNIYTYFGTTVNLNNSANAFALANAAITPALLGLGSDTTARDNLIKFVHGYDAYDDNGNGVYTEKRSWILGSFLHSRPFIIHYSDRSVIFAGSNDGMLHAFDDSNGTELWGFIPPNVLNKLQALHADVVESFVDGSPRAYITYNSSGGMTKALLIFGERRGGNHYYALDVTDPLSPKYEWKISPDTSIGGVFPYAQLGQTWSSPNIATINDGTASGKTVIFIGGGYDANQDNDSVPLPDDQWGRAIYVVDVSNGSLVWRYSFAEDANMKYCIPSDIAKVDIDGDGKVDRLYVGDLGGRVWRFDIADANPNNWVGKIIFKSNPDSATDLRKIFYPPDVTLENDDGEYELVLFGTGDREHPKATTPVDRLYAVKDKNLLDKDPPTAYVEGDLLDVTSDILQTGTDAERSLAQSQLRASKGWYIKLDSNSGEKSLAPPLVFYKTAYFTTFSPTDESGAVTDPCFVGEGIARLYALRYNNGNSVFNFDATNDVGLTSVLVKTDRSKTMGTAIPSGVIITFIGGKAVAYVGVGGGVYTPQLPKTSSLVPINWRIVF
jgi:type IV pilus assembly protein PilY1